VSIKNLKEEQNPWRFWAGERSCYTLLTFVCLKIELNWRSKPIGKVAGNLPLIKNLAENNFTQKR